MRSDYSPRLSDRCVHTTPDCVVDRTPISHRASPFFWRPGFSLARRSRAIRTKASAPGSRANPQAEARSRGRTSSARRATKVGPQDQRSQSERHFQQAQRPASREHEPEQPIGAAKPRSPPARALQHGELVAEGKDLRLELKATAESWAKSAQQRDEHGAHAVRRQCQTRAGAPSRATPRSAMDSAASASALARAARTAK